ncbi:MT-A70 family protein [Oxytricha trifallax]|uniref:mRNA m(6)A methyltransferase n=1 Tax=Oxytricha trifallax TaxID=1172189 RepID=A0A073HZM0_9SPIT|nr:MT-A70 family protein [Oxytricha trifallax]
MVRTSNLPIIDLVEVFKCQFCGSKHDSSGALSTHYSNYHKLEAKTTKERESILKRTCSGCDKLFSRSNDCSKHEPHCLQRQQKTKAIQKKKQNDSKQGFIQGPCMALVEVFKDHELLPLQRKTRNLHRKKLTDPVVFDGDVRDLEMWQQIAADAIERYKELYQVVLMDPAYRIKQSVPYPTLSDQEILALPIEVVQERGILILWFVNQKKDLAREFLRVHGYDEVEKGEWVKLTANLKLHKGSGMNAAHNNESFLIGKKGKVSDIMRYHVTDNVLFAKTGKHSQKPECIYDFIHQWLQIALTWRFLLNPIMSDQAFTSFGNQLRAAMN